MTCLFATDLHGDLNRYSKLFALVEERPPDALFLGGDLFPHTFSGDKHREFLASVICEPLLRLRRVLGETYPEVFAILGNDDPRFLEPDVVELEARGLWTYVHEKIVTFGDFVVLGYGCVPPSPFSGKDWEKYDVSRYVPPGAVSPEEGSRSVPVDPREIRYGNIAEDLANLAGDRDLSKAILLFHTPPYETSLDRVARDGLMVDHVPLDLFVGSIAVRRFIEERQPLLGLHGHIHESTRLTGSWKDTIGGTSLFNAAHDGPELSIIVFDPDHIDRADRLLL